MEVNTPMKITNLCSGQKKVPVSVVCNAVPLAFRFRFRFPLRFVAESVPYKVNGGQTVKNKYACLSYEYYN